VAVGAVGGVEGLEVELVDRLDTNQARWSSSSQSRRSGRSSSGWSRSQVRKFCGMGHFLAANGPIVVMALDTRTALLGAGWMLAGVLTYLLYRRQQKLPLASTVKVAGLEPLGVEEVEYESILIAFEEDPFSEEMVATADRLAKRRRHGIHVLSLIDVPTHLPLDAPLEAEESEAQSKIERTKLICGSRATGHVERVRPGQAGHVIIQEAGAIKAAAVVMQLRYRNGTPLYGRTLRTVLAERPCRVIVAAEPTRYARKLCRAETLPLATPLPLSRGSGRARSIWRGACIGRRAGVSRRAAVSPASRARQKSRGSLSSAPPTAAECGPRGRSWAFDAQLLNGYVRRVSSEA
jgi:hypothetical protein